MKRVVLFFALLISPALVTAQILIGDIEVPSLEAFVNSENESYWDEIGALNFKNSEYWIPNFPSMINNRNEQTVVQLAFKRDLDVFSVRTTLTNRFNTQVGQSQAIESPAGLRLSPNGWIVEEGRDEYLIAFSRDPRDGTLFIIKN